MAETIARQRLRRLDPELLQLDHSPISGGAPPFPIEPLCERVQELFGIKSVKIKAATPNWIREEELLIGIGESPIVLPLVCSPIPTPTFWVMAQSDLTKLMVQLVSGDQEAAAVLEESMRDAFAHFLLLELLQLLEAEEYPGNHLSFRCADPIALPHESALAIDLSITLSRRKIQCRILLPASFYAEWCRRFAKQRVRHISDETLRELSLVLHLEIGQTTLSLAEWSDISPGDFLLLESIDTERVAITLEGETLFGGRLGPEGVVIEPPPIAQEVKEPMDEERDDLEISNDSVEADEEEEEWAVEEEEESPRPRKSGTLSAKEIPILLKVEIGQIVTQADKLLSMEPGNVIELKRGLEEGVDLVVNGRRVGRGELMQIGDQLGVRITEVG